MPHVMFSFRLNGIAIFKYTRHFLLVFYHSNAHTIAGAVCVSILYIRRCTCACFSLSLSLSAILSLSHAKEKLLSTACVPIYHTSTRIHMIVKS